MSEARRLIHRVRSGKVSRTYFGFRHLDSTDQLIPGSLIGFVQFEDLLESWLLESLEQVGNIQDYYALEFGYPAAKVIVAKVH